MGMRIVGDVHDVLLPCMQHIPIVPPYEYPQVRSRYVQPKVCNLFSLLSEGGKVIPRKGEKRKSAIGGCGWFDGGMAGKGWMDGNLRATSTKKGIPPSSGGLQAS